MIYAIQSDLGYLKFGSYGSATVSESADHATLYSSRNQAELRVSRVRDEGVWIGRKCKKPVCWIRSFKMVEVS